MTKNKTRGDAIEQTLRSLVEARGVGKTICPSEVARAIDPENWRPLMKPVRDAARHMAKSGEIAIYRKGKPVDPDNFKGVIRLGLPPAEGDRRE